MLKKVSWEENSVYSVHLRENLYTLVQMRKNSIMQFFGVSRSGDDWAGVDLNNEESIFFIFVAENRLKEFFSSKWEPQQVAPSLVDIPKLMLSPVYGVGGITGANLVELTDEYSSYGAKIIKYGISANDDLELIYKYELVGMFGDANKIKKRLIRYFETGINWDESKHFVFKDIEPPTARGA